MVIAIQIFGILSLITFFGLLVPLAIFKQIFWNEKDFKTLPKWFLITVLLLAIVSVVFFITVIVLIATYQQSSTEYY